MSNLKDGPKPLESLRAKLFPLVKELYLAEKAVITQVNKGLMEKRRNEASSALEAFRNALSPSEKLEADRLEEEIEDWCDKNLNRSGHL